MTGQLIKVRTDNRRPKGMNDTFFQQSSNELAPRRRSRIVMVGGIPIGGDAPITVQSMTRTQTSDVAATVAQIQQLEQAGCDIVRVAISDEKAARAIPAIKAQIRIPLVADVHFDHRLALLAIEAGADKIRINPGNIKTQRHLFCILEQASKRNIPIRIGINAGSLESELMNRYGHPCAEALVASALKSIERCERWGFASLVVSLKSSDVPTMIDAYRMIATQIDYPLHLGITEAGVGTLGLIKNSIGIGALLKSGIGDTIRVALTGDPRDEVLAGRMILQALRLRRSVMEIVSCPTCGRSSIDVAHIVAELRRRFADHSRRLRVAVMGCMVNGPGEARQADIGVAGGPQRAVLFVHGRPIKKIAHQMILDELCKAIANYDSDDDQFEE
ncbi:MAG: flavodoxin-dependent (E)-4-hydroxy-3-methylbut-2-enyl-diphosphate synthase [candidate division KSB1 bacterium]|nr:flavodoxin-dependent (E)-4-hydroxy-3-methylbut-2-enyl-diphosphate synthase [candidate division KSB1 bacterium]